MTVEFVSIQTIHTPTDYTDREIHVMCQLAHILVTVMPARGGKLVVTAPPERP